MDIPLEWNSKALHREEDTVEFVDDGHYYLVNGEKMTYSTTGLVHKFFHEFDVEGTANRMVNKPGFYSDIRYTDYWELLKTDPKLESSWDTIIKNSKLKDLAAKMIMNKWETDRDLAAKEGTAMHESIENYYKTGVTVGTKEFKMFMNFHEYVTGLGYLPFRSEQIVYSIKYSIGGSVDMLYIHKDDVDENVKKIALYDWKRSREIKKTGFGWGAAAKGFGPMRDKQDCNYEHYSLQLNIYKYLLERSYKVEITRMALVILHPNQDNYELHEVSDNKQAVRKILKSIEIPQTDSD